MYACGARRLFYDFLLGKTRMHCVIHVEHLCMSGPIVVKHLEAMKVPESQQSPSSCQDCMYYELWTTHQKP